MQSRSVVFKAPFEIDIVEEAIPGPGPGKVLVRTAFSAISQGTEMLFYRGMLPEGLAVDEGISALQQPLHYPLKYGYATVGEVIEAGPGVSRGFIGRTVFCLHPHQSFFTAGVEEIMPVPPGMDPRDAVFLAGMETAVNLLMDGGPVIGEKAVVFGQGVVGLLTAALLALFPLGALLTLDRFQLRREASRTIGARSVLDPAKPNALETAIERLDPAAAEGTADLVYELTGNPEALDPAIALAGFDGRIVVGSWYGRKKAAIDLGGRFHRRRIRLISSQVSTVTPALTPRWSKHRRLDTAWDMLDRIRPSRFITQQVPLQQAPEAYALINDDPGATIQVVLEHESG